MIWHETQSPAVIVMLTQTQELNREKCFAYYPEHPEVPEMKLNEHDEFGDGFIHDLKMISLEEDADARAQVRELEMSSEDDEDPMKIWHLLFAGWPDFSVPEGPNRAALLGLIDVSREKSHAENPRIIHCSAGVGRTGSFIAIDWLFRELDEGSLDNVPDDFDPVWYVVDIMRQQRTMMVQGDGQLGFIYDAIRERWQHRWIDMHPQEAEQLGLINRHEEGPKLKRVKSGRSTRDGDVGERAQVETELMDAELGFEQGRA
jgi:protein-tyrosine phosphatase